MAVHQITPVYRFFSKKDYAEDMAINGNIRFTPVSHFGELNDVKYKDEEESYCHLKIRNTKNIIVKDKDGIDFIVAGGDVHSTYRRLEDAWAFCGTTSIISEARKAHCVVVTHFGRFMNELQRAVERKFNEKLTILFGPVSYYDRHMDMFNSADTPPYFAKDKKFCLDFEFRVVIVPSDKIYDMGQPFYPFNLQLENPDEIFKLTTIVDPQ